MGRNVPEDDEADEKFRVDVAHYELMLVESRRVKELLRIFAVTLLLLAVVCLSAAVRPAEVHDGVEAPAHRTEFAMVAGASFVAGFACMLVATRMGKN